MRAIAVTPSTQQIALIDQPGPEISLPIDVKLRMLEAGVCGTRGPREFRRYRTRRRRTLAGGTKRRS